MASSKSFASSGSIVKMNSCAQILPARRLRFAETSGAEAPRPRGRTSAGKWPGQPVFPDDRKHVHAGAPAAPEHLDHMALGIHVARRPGIELRDDLVARPWRAREAGARGRRGCGQSADRPRRRRKSFSISAACRQSFRSRDQDADDPSLALGCGARRVGRPVGRRTVSPGRSEPRPDRHAWRSRCFPELI